MWDAHGLDTELGAGIDGNHQLLLEGCHQRVRNPTPTFSSAFARALLWWLPRPAGLHWRAKATSAIDTRVTDRLISPAKSFSEPALYTWSLQRYNSATWNENCNKPKTQPGILPVPSLSLMNLTGFTTPWAAHHRPSLNHSPHYVIKEKEWQPSVWRPMSILFLNLKSNL